MAWWCGAPTVGVLRDRRVVNGILTTGLRTRECEYALRFHGSTNSHIGVKRELSNPKYNSFTDNIIKLCVAAGTAGSGTVTQLNWAALTPHTHTPQVRIRGS